MKFKSAEKMQNAIETILMSHHLLESFRNTQEFYVKISVGDSIMPLTIERQGARVIVSHYYEQNGDLVPDPDMEFEIYQGTWLPIAIQHNTGHYFRAMEGEGLERKVDFDLFDELREFSDMWSRNLLEQGFAKGKVVRVE